MRAPDLEARAASALEGAATVPAVLSATCRLLIEVLDAQACAISRLVGELLVQIEEVVQPGRSLIIGQGYVLTDYPLTREVLENRQSRALSVFDPDADPAEDMLLRELGYEALLMAPLVVADETWGLVEVYDAGERTFSDEDVELGVRLIARAGARIADLGA
jgi:GAF domain-containing protein